MRVMIVLGVLLMILLTPTLLFSRLLLSFLLLATLCSLCILLLLPTSFLFFRHCKGRVRSNGSFLDTDTGMRGTRVAGHTTKLEHTLPMAAPSSPSLPPNLHLVLRGREALYSQLFVAGEPVVGPKSRPETGAPKDFPVKGGYDASSGISPMSQDGTLVAATLKECVEVYDISSCSTPRLKCTVAQGGVVCCSFSPLGDLLLTWHRKKGEEGVYQMALL